MSRSKRPNLNFAGILSREAEQSRGSDTSAVGLFGDHPARHLATCRPAQSRLARVANRGVDQRRTANPNSPPLNWLDRQPAQRRSPREKHSPRVLVKVR